MIGRISGQVIEKSAPLVVVDVNGVGYEVLCPMSTFYEIGELSHKITLFTHLVVREDAQLLYGFAQDQERRLFRSLIKVNGVGPKLALTILSGISVGEFVLCVRADDSSTLIKLPGVGKKTAERLLIEMRDRLKDWHVDGEPNIVDEGSSKEVSTANSMLSEAEGALIALGYKPQEASRSLASLNCDDYDSSSALIREALKRMVSK